MSDHELRSETERMLALRADVERELQRLPGVVGVGVGVRERGGQPVNELVFRVYVRQKRRPGELNAGELLPDLIRGYGIDVHSIGKAVRECCGATRPLLAGVRMTKEPFSTFQNSSGTLGCFLALPDGTEVALSNEHVLESKGGGDRRVFQPEFKSFAEMTCNLIGESVTSAGHEGVYSFQNVVQFIDCAVVDLAKVDFINKFVKHENSRDGEQTITVPGVAGSVKRNAKGLVTEIRDGSDAVVDATKILGSDVAVPNTLVFKVGQATGLTVGRVMDIAAPITFSWGPEKFDAPHQILVRPVAGHLHTASQEAFTEAGDSGSVYVNLANRVVGLHHRKKETEQHVLESYGCHIAPVLRRVGTAQASATVIATDGATTHKTGALSTQLARELWADAPAPAHRLDDLEREMRERLARSVRGRVLLRVLEQHLPEVLVLVWQRRAVTIAWHRHHGPAFVALFARAVTRPDSRLPREAGGVSRRAMLNAMANILETHGSPGLRTDLAANREWLLEALAECDSVAELQARLAEEAA